jgi:hypothetical protein
LKRVEEQALGEIQSYLEEHRQENMIVLSDLIGRHDQRPTRRNRLSLRGYREGDTIIAVLGTYEHGRAFPHWTDDTALEAILEDVRQQNMRWLMGVQRVVDPLLQRLTAQGYRIRYDEKDFLCYVDRAHLQLQENNAVRRATMDDLDEVTELRCRFEVEYFHTRRTNVSTSWCRDIARRYIHQGVYVAERAGEIISMVAVEAAALDVAQVGAVYTNERYRGQGLAKSVVSAICKELLGHKNQVTLTVRRDNTPALAAYRAIGFQRWCDYRMTRLS